MSVETIKESYKLDESLEFKKGFAAAAIVETLNVEINMEEIEKVFERMEEKDGDIIIAYSYRNQKELEQRTVVFKTFCPEKKKIMHFEQTKLEQALKGIWHEIEYIEEI